MADRRPVGRFAALSVGGLLITWLAATAVPACARRSDAQPSGPPPSGPALPVGPIGHQGRWLTDAEGRVLLLHGVNMVDKEAPYYPAAAGFSDADAAWLADNGFLLVRVGILATGLMPSPGAVDSGYLDQVAATVKDLASHGIYSLLDLHQDGWGPVTGSDGFPAWMTVTGGAANVDAGFPYYYQQNPALQQAFQSFWDDAPGPGDAGLQDDYAAMFSAVAARFAGEPYVLGYDLFNEPWPGTTWDACLNDPAGCPTLDQGELGPAYARAVAAIRAAGDHHLVFGEPFSLFNFGVSTTSMPLPGGDSNTGMSFHVYPLSPNQAANVASNAVAWSATTGGALLNTEWGATTSTIALTPQVLALDEALVPWIFWSFCCELVPSLQQPAGGSNLVTSTASVLVQPYPLAVAGTPQQLTVDPSAGTLSFTWSTAAADGGALGSDAVTSFAVPKAVYPSGYTATADHGWITSAPCAPVLTVAAQPGADTVTVDVQPGGSCP
jgi:endoglycosylceramidase